MQDYKECAKTLKKNAKMNRSNLYCTIFYSHYLKISSHKKKKLHWNFLSVNRILFACNCKD